MCLAIAKPANAIVPVEHLHAGYQGNPHGCGFAYAENGKLTIVKGLFSFKDFMLQYRKFEHLPMLIHFRYSTHGQPTVANCHPFAMWDGRYALIHNGMIHIAQSISKEMSDTGHFSKLIMEPMLKAGINPEKAAFRYLVEEAIGGNNKVCLMDNAGKITIYCESNGEYEDAVDRNDNPVMVNTVDGPEQATVWYSNAGYKFTRRRCKQRAKGDCYDGFFDCGSGAEEVTPADFTQVGEGFQGIPQSETSSQFAGRAKLDQPPAKVIVGFRAGVRETTDPSPDNAGPNVPVKGAAEAAEAIVEAFGGTVIRTERNGTTIKLAVLPKVGDLEDDHNIKGPLYDVKAELEISHLKSTMNITREAAIRYLGLEEQDAVSFKS